MISHENHQCATCLTSIAKLFTWAKWLKDIDLETRKKEQIIKTYKPETYGGSDIDCTVVCNFGLGSVGGQHWMM
jgi:hypothetical protein